MVVRPDAGSTVTSHRSVLSVERTEATAWRPSGDKRSVPQRRSRLVGGGAGAGEGGGAAPGSSPSGGFGMVTGSLKPTRPAHTPSPVFRFRMASRRRSCASPTLVRAAISSVYDDSLT